MTKHYVNEKNELKAKLSKVVDAVETIRNAIDELGDLRTDIINEREGLSENSSRGIELDDLLMQVESARNAFDQMNFVYEASEVEEFLNK